MASGETFDADGVTIAYDDRRAEPGGNEPIVLVHGFASNRANNWADSGWYETLAAEGRRVIALDNRGHGESDKPRDPSAYDISTMAGDVIALMDHLDVAEADLLGYSMGGRIGLDLVQYHPERFNAAVLGGVGSSLITDSGGDREAIAEGLLADDVEDIDHPTARNFRLFAESTGADREALAAVIRAHSEGTPDYDLGRVGLPVLVAAGEDDEIVGDPVGLATEFGNAEAAVIPGEDHLSTVPHEEFEAVVTDFLRREGL